MLVLRETNDAPKLRRFNFVDYVPGSTIEGEYQPDQTRPPLRGIFLRTCGRVRGAADVSAERRATSWAGGRS